MTTAQSFQKELSLEAQVTRRYLERVPFDKLDFKPAEKSETLGRLAIHLAEIIEWWTSCLKKDKLDFLGFEPKKINSSEELLNYFDQLLEEAKRTLTEAKEEDFDKKWSMTYGDEILLTLPKRQVVRVFCMNHLVHHRAQLGVYLRILGIEVPATYGPSADDENVILIKEVV